MTDLNVHAAIGVPTSPDDGKPNFQLRMHTKDDLRGRHPPRPRYPTMTCSSPIVLSFFLFRSEMNTPRFIEVDWIHYARSTKLKVPTTVPRSSFESFFSGQITLTGACLLHGLRLWVRQLRPPLASPRIRLHLHKPPPDRLPRYRDDCP